MPSMVAGRQHLIEADLFRFAIQPSPVNGLRDPSQVMVDKIIAVKSSRIRERIGRLTAKQTAELDGLLRRWLGLD